jgi:hypothetical protein
MKTQATCDLPECLFSIEEGEDPPKVARLSDWAKRTRSGKPKTAKPKTIAAAVFNRARAETSAMMETGDWSSCTARHLVALYDLMHVKCYGVEASMSSSERHTLVLRAGGFVKREFSGDYDRAIDYFRWLWTREMGREKWRRENHREGMRVTLGMCLSGMVITDYRLHLTRTRS